MARPPHRTWSQGHSNAKHKSLIQPMWVKNDSIRVGFKLRKIKECSVEIHVQMKMLQRKSKESTTIRENKSYFGMEEKDQEGTRGLGLLTLFSFCLGVYVCCL